jgi:hypothetical protein
LNENLGREINKRYDTYVRNIEPIIQLIKSCFEKDNIQDKIIGLLDEEGLCYTMLYYVYSLNTCKINEGNVKIFNQKIGLDINKYKHFDFYVDNPEYFRRVFYSLHIYGELNSNKDFLDKMTENGLILNHTQLSGLHSIIPNQVDKYVRNLKQSERQNGNMINDNFTGLNKMENITCIECGLKMNGYVLDCSEDHKICEHCLVSCAKTNEEFIEMKNYTFKDVFGLLNDPDNVKYKRYKIECCICSGFTTF